MKYTPKLLKDNVNVSSKSPLRDLAELILKTLGVLLIIYVLLGFTVDMIAPRISPALECRLGKVFAKKAKQVEFPETEQKLRVLLDALVAQAGLPPLPYTVHITASDEMNAMALPGGTIMVLGGLLEKVKSENGVAMVLAHELGHYYYRHHLRAIGRSLVFLVISSVTVGADSSVTKLIANSISNAEMRFSQEQEKAADLFALRLLEKTYGHVGGALDFYQEVSRKEKIPRFLFFFASHPSTRDRIKALENIIFTEGYTVGKPVLFDFSEKTVKKKRSVTF